MTRPEALAALLITITDEPSEAAVKAAFNLAMLGAHPDTSPVGSAAKVERVKFARDYLLRPRKDGAEPCVLCGGSGYVCGMKCSSCGRKVRL